MVCAEPCRTFVRLEASKKNFGPINIFLQKGQNFYDIQKLEFEPCTLHILPLHVLPPKLIDS